VHYLLLVTKLHACAVVAHEKQARMGDGLGWWQELAFVLDVLTILDTGTAGLLVLNAFDKLI